MPFLKGENPHRPAPGSVLKVEPIRDKRAIGRIKKMLRDHPRDLCLFVVEMNGHDSDAPDLDREYI